MEDKKSGVQDSEPFERGSEPFANSKRFNFTQKKSWVRKSAREVLYLLTVEFLTPKEIASRRKTSLRSVYKIIKKLKEKGMFDAGFNSVNLLDRTPHLSEPFANQIRLHGEQWVIKILSKSEGYEKARERSNTVIIDKNIIKLHDKSLEIYSGQSFYAKTAQEATSQALAYWQGVFARLEHDLGVIIIKDRYQNIKLVKAHYARGDSEIYQYASKEGKMLQVRSTVDGKVWFITDDSFGFNEDETIHPSTNKQDRETVDKYVNDWRDKDPPTNSELAIHIKDLVSVQEYHAENIKTHIAAIQTLGSNTDSLKKTIDELVQVVKELKR